MEGHTLTIIGNSRPKEIEAVYLDSTEFTYVHRILTKNVPYWHITPVLLDKFSGALNDFFICSDRVSYFPVQNSKLVEIFHQLLNRFVEIFTKSKFDLVCYPVTPHVPWTLLSYHVAKYFGCKVIIIERTQIADTIVFNSDFRYSMIKKPTLEDADELGAHIKSMGFEDSITLAVAKKYNEKFVGSRKSLSGIDVIERIKQLLRSLVKVRLWRKKKVRYDKVDIIDPALSFNDKFESRPASGRVTRVENKRRLVWLRKVYDTMAAPVELNAQYVYFPLHLQPEKTTMPLGGVYQSLYLAVRKLKASLPEGMAVYVKEHPRQFDSDRLINSTTRFSQFYELLAGIPGVKLVQLSMDSEALIKHAMFVATVTGSAGWEALRLGVPVLTFAKIWYSIHPFCFGFDDAEFQSGVKILLSVGRFDAVHAMRIFSERAKDFLFIGTNRTLEAKKSSLELLDILQRTRTALGRIIVHVLSQR